MCEAFSLDYSSVNWIDVVYYDETSPTFLRWKNTKDSGKHKIIKDQPAGTINTKAGTSAVTYNKSCYRVHRIIWILFNGNIDNTLVIDHIDGNGLNNKIENLRLVSRSINSRNTKIKSTNSTGIKGICLRSIGGYDNYVVQWNNLDGKRGSKSFSCNFYGYSVALELAKDFRFKKMEELNNLGEGYTERHIYGE